MYSLINVALEKMEIIIIFKKREKLNSNPKLDVIGQRFCVLYFVLYLFFPEMSNQKVYMLLNFIKDD